MEPTWSQKGINKSMISWLGFRTPLETSMELRRGCKDHTFSSRPPRAAPYYQRLLYNNKQRQVASEDLTRLGPLARRIERKEYTIQPVWSGGMKRQGESATCRSTVLCWSHEAPSRLSAKRPRQTRVRTWLEGQTTLGKYGIIWGSF